MSKEKPEIGDVFKTDATTVMVVSTDSSNYTEVPDKFMWLAYDDPKYIGAIGVQSFMTTDEDAYLGNIRDLLPKIAKVLDSNSKT